LNSQGLFFSQHNTLGVLIIVLISFFDKSKIFRLEAIQSRLRGLLQGRRNFGGHVFHAFSSSAAAAL
jgi:hypothetical protein